MPMVGVRLTTPGKELPRRTDMAAAHTMRKGPEQRLRRMDMAGPLPITLVWELEGPLPRVQRYTLATTTTVDRPQLIIRPS